MFIQTIPVGVFRCNCSVIACEVTRKAVVVDPGDDADRILEIIRGNNLDVTTVIHTHAHIDHIMGSFEVVSATGAEARLHDADRRLWDGVDRIAESYSIPVPKTPRLSDPLEDGETIRFGQAQIAVIHTPGHTSGSCCFTLDLDKGPTLLFSGDTLFRRKIGFASPYPDRKDNLHKLLTSIRERLFTLDDDTRVVPGHGPETHIGFERRHNPFFAEASGDLSVT